MTWRSIMPGRSGPGLSRWSRTDFLVVAVVGAWFAVNALFPPLHGWAAWLLVDWAKRVVLVMPLLLHPETGLWIRSAFTRGTYRYEGPGLFVLRVVSTAVLLLVLHHFVEWVRLEWLQPLDTAQVDYPAIEDPYWQSVDLVFGLILVAFSEEILARVVLLRWLVSRLRHEWLAIAVSAVVFGLLHLNHGLDNVISSALLGIAFAVTYHHTRSIWPVVAGHYLIDFAVFA